METASTLLKALDLLTVLAARRDGLPLPELVQAMNQPRTNVVRLARTLELYGFIRQDARRWCTTPAFHAWAAAGDRHAAARARYRSVLRTVAERTGELVLLGLHEGNGIVHIDFVESDHRVRIAPAPATRHTLRHNALGKLALSRRPDLAAKIRDRQFQAELAEIRATGVAWNREETVRGMVALAHPGFTNDPTEPMLAVAWPAFLFSERKAREAVRVLRESLRVAGK